MKLPAAALLVLPPLAFSCAGAAPPVAPEIPVSEAAALPAAHAAEADWKERMARPYVYLEHRGDYRDLGAVMRALLEAAVEAELELDGSPFALFFDDPGSVPVAELQSRACLPVALDTPVPQGLSFEILPAGLVVYSRVAGAYPEAPRAYPALFRFLGEMGWRAGGPVREIYLVNPAEVAGFEELVTEIQVPAGNGPRR